jgi:hypothetical protein
MEHTGAPSSVGRDAWERTLAEMDELAGDHEADGWETLAIPGGVASPKRPGTGESDRFGFIHVVPGNYADEFDERFGDCAFDAYDVFRREIEGEVYFVTVLYDTDARAAVFVAAAYETGVGERLREVAEREGVLFTHMQRLDGTHVCSVEHEDFEKFFAPAED